MHLNCRSAQLEPQRLHITETSTTRSKRFSALSGPSHVHAPRQAREPCPRTASAEPPNNCRSCLGQYTCRCSTTGTPTLFKNCTCVTRQFSALSGPIHLSLQHDRNANLVQKLHLRTPDIFRHSLGQYTCRSTGGHDSNLARERKCKNSTC